MQLLPVEFSVGVFKLIFHHFHLVVDSDIVWQQREECVLYFSKRTFNKAPKYTSIAKQLHGVNDVRTWIDVFILQRLKSRKVKFGCSPTLWPLESSTTFDFNYISQR